MIILAMTAFRLLSALCAVLAVFLELHNPLNNVSGVSIGIRLCNLGPGDMLRGGSIP
jgi:hypothetical protein